MKFINTDFKDLIIIKHDVIKDSRGFFKEKIRLKSLETYTKRKFNFCQENCVMSKFNVIREKVKSEARPILENKLKEKREMIINKNTNCNYQKCINDYNRIRSLLRELDDEDDKC